MRLTIATIARGEKDKKQCQLYLVCKGLSSIATVQWLCTTARVSNLVYWCIMIQFMAVKYRVIDIVAPLIYACSMLCCLFRALFESLGKAATHYKTILKTKEHCLFRLRQVSSKLYQQKLRCARVNLKDEFASQTLLLTKCYHYRDVFFILTLAHFIYPSWMSNSHKRWSTSPFNDSWVLSPSIIFEHVN